IVPTGAPDDALYRVNFENPTTISNVTKVADLSGNSLEWNNNDDFAIDEATGVLYGRSDINDQVNNERRSVLYSYDLNTGLFGIIADTTYAFDYVNRDNNPTDYGDFRDVSIGISVGLDGVLYGTDSSGGLLAIDKQTGATSLIRAYASHDGDLAVGGDLSNPFFASALSTATVSGVVNPVNDRPALTGDSEFSINENAENGTTVAAISVTDADLADTHTLSIVGGSDLGVFSIDNSGRIVVADSTRLDFETTQSFDLQVRVTDAGGLSDDIDIVINLTDQNDTAPTIRTGQSFRVDETAEAGTNLGRVVAVDEDTIGQLGNWEIVGGNDDNIFAIDAITGELRIDDPIALDFESQTSHTLQIRVSDGFQDAAIQTVNVDLTDINESPTVELTNLVTSLPDDTDTTNEIRVADITLNDDALGSNQLTLLGPDQQYFQIVGTELQLRPSTNLDSDRQQNFEVTIVASDPTLGSGPQEEIVYILTITSVDVEPKISEIADQTISEDTATQPIPFVISNPDGHEFSIEATSTNGHLLPTDAIAISLDGDTGSIQLTPARNQNGTAQITVTIRTEQFSSSTTFTLTVNPINDAPTIVNRPAIDVEEDTAVLPIALNQLFADVDSATNEDSLTFTIVESPSSLISLSSINGSQLDLQLVPNQNGSGSVTILATDSAGETATYSIPLRVRSVNDAPTAVQPTLERSFEEDSPQQTIQLSTLFDDVDLQTNSDELNFSLVSNNASQLLIAEVIGSELRIQFAPDQSGFETIVIEATDIAGEAVQLVLGVNVTAVNDAPVVLPETYRTGAVASLIAEPGALLLNDTDQDSTDLRTQLVSPTSNGVLTFSDDGAFTYTPNRGFFGTDGFEYQVTDGTSTSEPVSVAIYVTAELTNPGIVVVNTPTNSSEQTPTTTTTSVAKPSATQSEPDSNPTESIEETTSTKKDTVLAAPVASSIKKKKPASTSDTAASVDPKLVEEITPGAIFASIIREIQDAEEPAPDSSIDSQGSTVRRTVQTQILGTTRRGEPVSHRRLVINFGSTAEEEDRRREEQKQQQQAEVLVAGTTAVVSTGLSVGYVIWLVRGGTLLASMVSALPAWVAFDPLPVLESYDNEGCLDEDELSGVL
ncbi:MAG: Ig-like domain-containing protein, partial [Planctomycetaceae bacterium]